MIDDIALKAIWQQARLSLTAGFRKILITHYQTGGWVVPVISLLAEEIVSALEAGVAMSDTTIAAAKDIWRSEVSEMNEDEKGILALYFYSKNTTIENIKEAYYTGKTDGKPGNGTDDDAEIGKIIINKIAGVTEDELVAFCLQKLEILTEIVPGLIARAFDADTLVYANRCYQALYLGLLNLRFELFPRAESESAYWGSRFNYDGEDEDEAEDDEDYIARYN